MIKGKYVGTVIIDICVDENKPNLLPFEKLKEETEKKLNVVIRDILQDELDDIATVSVSQQYADLYKTED